MKCRVVLRLGIGVLVVALPLLGGSAARSDTVGSGPSIVLQTTQTPQFAAPVNCDQENITLIPASECYALVDFYRAAGGPGWKNNDGWLTDVWPCVWYGVECTKNPNVDPEKDKWSWNVTVLWLGYNNVTAIPPVITAFSHLRDLDLRGSGFGGPVPGFLGSLRMLGTLLLGDNAFTSVDPAIGGLTQLRFLDLEGNRLSSLPSSLGGLSSLETLDISENSFTSLPGAIAGMSNLKQLDVSDNSLSGPLPAWIGNLTNLEDLALDSNRITELPPQIGKLVNLKWLSAYNNRLTQLPPEIGGLASLEMLFLPNNRIAYIPPEIGDLKNLKVLEMSSNEVLGGQIPSSLGKLSNLEGLFLQHNALVGQIPPSLGSLMNLRGLNLSFNRLTGPIPTTFGQLAKLEGLSVESNQLTGSIPGSLGGLIYLEKLNLSNNRLTGPLPPQLGYLPSLQVLEAYNNMLSGPIPPQLGLLENLTTLNLAANRFGLSPGLTGHIPTELSNLRNLTFLDLSRNSLTGQVPAWLFALPELVYVNLSDNKLEGQLPALSAAAADEVSGAAASKLEVVDVSYNRLSGIQANWGTGVPLKRVNLRGNQIAQGIPPKLFQISSLESLDLGDNRLTGPIPDVSRLTNLKTLRLDRNNLTGTIPAGLGTLRNLTQLFLGGNALTGSVPGEIGNLTGLTALDVSRNPLQGSLPQSLANLTTLQAFWYRDTQLCAPGNATFQNRLDGVASRGMLHASGLVCAGSPVSATVAANAQTTLTSSQDQTRYTFPPNTFPAGTTITHEPQPASTQSVQDASAAALKGIGHTFEVVAKNSSGQTVQPSRPFTITIGFSANQAAGVVPSTLALYYWDGARWEKEATSRVDVAQRIVSATPSHLSRWAVLGEARSVTRRLHLAAVARGEP